MFKYFVLCKELLNKGQKYYLIKKHDIIQKELNKGEKKFEKETIFI